jgi:exosortase B
VSSIASQTTADDFGSRALSRRWWPVALGIAVLYVPTYVGIYQAFWYRDRGTPGPVVLAIVVWLISRERQLFHVQTAVSDRMRRLGIGLLVGGLGCYVLGRSQTIYQLEVLSQIPVLLGITCVLLGRPGIRRLWFPIMLLLFLVPIPGSIMDALLFPLKQWVSEIVEWLLYMAGLPIARNGVVLTIGNYSLLISDACSGLNSMVALAGIGLLYVYLAGHRSRWMNAVLLVSVLPIAFAANVIRVLLLVVLTYLAGDVVGRSFHDNAGYLEIAAAFGLFFAVDHLLNGFLSLQHRPEA